LGLQLALPGRGLQGFDSGQAHPLKLRVLWRSCPRQSRAVCANFSPSVPVAPPAVSSAAPSPPTIAVSRGSVLSCRDDSGESLKGKDCGRVNGFDPIAQARIKRIVSSPAAADNEGKLSILVTLDFATNKITFVDVGKSSTVKNPEAFKSLLTTQFQGVTLATVDHEQPRVTMSYSAMISAGNGSGHTGAVASSVTSARGSEVGDSPSTPAASHTAQNVDDSNADGTATISWDVAVVRDAPHTGAVVARLPRGTKVKLGDAQGGWYRIKFGNGFTDDGWLYRGALGK